MGYAVYDNDGRKAGYGVPAYCEHPGCDAEIDRGMSYACGGDPFQYGCSRYFCSKHVFMTLVESNCDDDPECDDSDCCVYRDVCERCKAGEAPFDMKPEHPEWVYHLLHHESWGEWRKNNPEEVEKLKKLPARPAEGEDYD